MYSIKNLCITVTLMLWSFSLLANLSKIAPKLTFRPGMKFYSNFNGGPVVSTELEITHISYIVEEALPHYLDNQDQWKKHFFVRIEKRSDGGYDAYSYPEYTSEGKEIKTLLGSFSRNDEDRTAVLEYKNPEDNSQVRMEFSNTRTKYPKIGKEKRTDKEYPIKVAITVKHHSDRTLLEIEDELKYHHSDWSWFGGSSWEEIDR